jgi:hypothetical protein
MRHSARPRPNWCFGRPALSDGLGRALLDYKAALENAAQAQEDMASRLALLANELEQQGQPKLADSLQRTCHQHRASGIKNRALAASLMGPTSPPTPLHHTPLPLTRGMRFL